MTAFVLFLLITTSNGAATVTIDMPSRRICEAAQEMIVSADAEERFPRVLASSCARKGEA